MAVERTDWSWVRTVWERTALYLQQLDQVRAITLRGIYQTVRNVGLIESMMELDRALRQPDSVISERKQQLEAVKADAEIAQQEIDRGYDTINRLATVGLWAALEAWIEDFMLAWLMNDPSALSRPEFEKMKMSIAQYESMSREERMSLLVSELQSATRSSFKPGAAQFETLLEVCGLSGRVESQVQRDLIELVNVRNVLLHRASIADSRFVANCPWLSIRSGDQISVRPDDYDRYRNAVFNYLVTVNVRVRERWLGQDVQEFPVASPDRHASTSLG